MLCQLLLNVDTVNAQHFELSKQTFRFLSRLLNNNSTMYIWSTSLSVYLFPIHFFQLWVASKACLSLLPDNKICPPKTSLKHHQRHHSRKEEPVIFWFSCKPTFWISEPKKSQCACSWWCKCGNQNWDRAVLV